MDPRQRRTREKLDATVLALAVDNPVEEISMTEIARESGVHRSTVHEYGGSPGDLLRLALVDELDAIRAELLADRSRDIAEAMTEVTARVLQHVRHYADIYRRGLSPEAGDGTMYGMLSEHFFGSIRALDEQGRLQWPEPVAGLSAAQMKAAAARFIAQGTVGAIQGWLELPDPDVASFLALYAELVPAWWGVTPA
jgi:AcrR family transcriptional regulator